MARRLGVAPALVAALLLGCGDERPEPSRPADEPERSSPGVPAGPPDAGTRFGHGAADARAGRGEARDVVVPQVDRTPPTATIRAAGVEAVSPSSPDDRARTVTLPTGRFRATAAAVDRDGGTGRVRLSLVYAVRCGTQVRRITEHRPPAQIARVRLAPGTPAPAMRERTATLRLRVGPGCSARGEVFAEASNAHGLDAVSRHIGVLYTRPRG